MLWDISQIGGEPINSCFFIGHKDAQDIVIPLLDEAVERHITEYGVTDFYVGGYGRFDSMAARAVINAKKQRPEIHLFLVLPYHPAIRPVEKPQGFDDTYYPWTDERIPKRFAIVRSVAAQRTIKSCVILDMFGGKAWRLKETITMKPCAG